MSDVQTDVHPNDHLSRVLTAIVRKLPWRSEDEQEKMLDHVRNYETAIKGEDAVKIVPAAPVNPSATAAPVSTPDGFDYDKFAAAMLRQQKIAEEQQKQAADAVADNPGFATPGAETVPESTTHAAASE